MHKTRMTWAVRAASAATLLAAASAFGQVAGSSAAACLATAGPDFAKRDLADCNFHAWPAGTLRGANFEGANLRGAVFDGQDLAGASFIGADLGPSAKGPASFVKAGLDRTRFVGARLDGTDFSYATITCADFASTALMKAVFGPTQAILEGAACRTNFAGAEIDVRAIDPTHWGKTDFSNTRFKNLSPQTFSLAGADIAGARLTGTNFSGIDMAGADLSGADLRGAKLVGAKMADTALNGIDLSGADLRFAVLSCARFHGGRSDDRDAANAGRCRSTRVSRAPPMVAKLVQATMQGADLTNATLDAAELAGANLSGATLRRASLVGASLEPDGAVGAASVLAADLSEVNFTEAHINNVQFNNVVLTRATFDRVTLNGTAFTDSTMPLASFDGATLESVTFHAANLQGASFRDTTMKTTPGGRGFGVNFSCAQLGGADFKDAKVFSADFQSAVMPPQDQCCPQPGGNHFCGLVAGLQQAYGGVTYPVPQAAVTCPDGSVAQCQGEAWTLRDWRTSLCSSERDIRTVWHRPDCGAPPGETIVFKDKRLEACILESLSGTPTRVAAATAEQMTQVSCPGREITSVSGLERFTRLASLDLSGNRLEQFALRLPALQQLKIANNRLSVLDLSGTRVAYLDAGNNRELPLIHGLAGLDLVYLDVSHNKLTRFDLAVQQGLVHADLSFNRLTAVLDEANASLRRLTSLAYLDLSHNSLASIGPLAAIAEGGPSATGRLASLYMSCNPGFDCGTLALLPEHAAAQSSTCAELNTLRSRWMLRPRPSCPEVR